MDIDPARKFLAFDRLGIGEAARAEYRDKQLDLDLLAGLPIDDVRLLARKVDERLLAGPVHLSHRRLQFLGPAAVNLAILAAAVAVGMDLGVLFPQQLKRHARPLEFLVNPRYVGRDPIAIRRRDRKQLRFQRPIVQIGWQRPVQACVLGAADVLRNRPHSHAAGPGDRPVAHAPLVFQPQNLS
jgi:hypothetical protein